MERVYYYLSSVYRMLIAGLLLYLYIKGMNGQHLDDHHLIVMAVISVYGIGFAAVPHRKWGAYLEWLVVLGFIQYFQDLNLIYFLLVIPFVHLVSLKTSQIDMIVFSFLLGVLYDFKTQSLFISVAIGVGVYITFALFNSQFKQIGIMQKAVFEMKKKMEEIRNDLSLKKAQIQIITKLFIHKKHLEDIDEVEMLVEQLLSSASDFYDAYYVKLYYFKDGTYISMIDKGENRKYQVPNDLSGEMGGEVFFNEQFMRVPISYEKQPWGCIAVYGKRSRLSEDGQRVFFPFEDSDYEILSLYIDSVMARMKELRSYEKLRKAALYDRLTGISNRTHLEEQFRNLVQTSKQKKQLFTVLIMDIDYFKKFNDEFGHLVGDEVLQLMALILKECADEKNGDIVGRWGGEEFMALLPGGRERGLEIAEKIRSSVENYPLRYRQMTISIGGACFGLDGFTMDELTKKADIALYYSKEHGRNQCSFYEGGD